MQTIAEALQSARNKLLSSGDSARLDAEILLAHVLQKPRSHLFAWPDKHLTASESKAFNALIGGRGSGEPIAYLTGIREFWSLALHVTPDTLIPRPETELLVEHALRLIEQTAAQRLLDLGTGSGAIALAIASELPTLEIVASDNSASALAVAKTNAERLGIGNVQFKHSDWLAKFTGQCFDLIVANPPYIEAEDPHLTVGDVAFEPRHALASGSDGLNAIRKIAHHADNYLSAQGSLIFEHGFAQATAVRNLLRDNGFTAIGTKQDLQGLDRISFGQRAMV